jgi:lipopolysaccharide/colanic/teichoic acid biosynthesis glycosyltransferase
MYVYRRKLYTAAQSVLDALSLGLIWETATHLRILLNPFLRRHVTLQESAGWVPPMSLVLLLWILVSWRLRLYRVPDEIRASTLLSWAGKNTLAVCTLTIVATFFSRQFGEGASRIFVFCMAPAAFFILAATRGLALGAIAAVQHCGHPPRIALLGDLTNARRLIGRMGLHVRTAVRGVIVAEGTAAEPAAQSPPVLGTTGQIAELVNRERIDRVIVLNGTLPDSEIERCHKVFWQMGLPVSCTFDLALEPDPLALWWQPQNRVNLSQRYGLSVLEVRRARLETQDILKAAFDFGLALISLLFLAPAMAVIAFFVKLTSKGPAFGKLPCVGKGGRHFTCLKFRTTYLDGDPALPGVRQPLADAAPVPHDAQRITPVGRFLRRYSLDELPQLINIIRGEMSFVGPRPLPARDLGPDGMSREFYAWSESRARVRPGLTGLWQVSGRSNLSFEDMIQLDLEYIQTRSFSLDVSIILETPMPVLRGVGAS